VFSAVLDWGTNTRSLSGSVDLKVLFIFRSFFFRWYDRMIVGFFYDTVIIQCLSYSYKE